MNNHLFTICAVLSISFLSCKDNKPATMQEAKSATKGTYAYDKSFLKNHDSVLVELTSGDASVLVSPTFQAKVFTSTASGDDGKSFGWINYKAFGVKPGPHINAYGGENRFWLGPEGGKYSLYFKQGDSMVFDNWQTPAPIDTEKWNVDKKDDKSITLKKDMRLTNFAGGDLQMEVTRTISIEDKNQIEQALSLSIGDSVKYVGYETKNVLKNTGDKEWKEPTGMPCIWILDMFNPSNATTIVVPHKPAKKGEKVATTDYFGQIPSDRIKMSDSILLFRADGKSRGKLGIAPRNALPFAGSYDAQNNVLTVTSFTVDNNGKYLNQEWNTVKPAFSGDAVNAYNDGPLPDGSQMGPFYELESVSPAAALKPSEEISHKHSVYHFMGPKEQLDKIARKAFGVSLQQIESTFSK